MYHLWKSKAYTLSDHPPSQPRSRHYLLQLLEQLRTESLVFVFVKRFAETKRSDQDIAFSKDMKSSPNLRMLSPAGRNAQFN